MKKTTLVLVWLNYNMHISYWHGGGILAALAKERGVDVYVYHVHPLLGNHPHAKKIAQDIHAHDPTIIGISSSTLEWGFAKELALACKRVMPKAMLVAGGPHVTFCGEAEDTTLFDLCIAGDGEYPLRDLLAGKTFTEKRVVGQLVEDLDSLPFANRELFDMQTIIDARNGIVDFMTQRGCPYDCAYCSNHALRKLYSRGYLRQRSVSNAIQEIKEVVQRHTCSTVFFHDDIFTLRKDWFKDFCEHYGKEVGLPWMINSHVKHVDDEVVRYLKKYGCTEVKLGVESGDETLRNKVLNKKISNEHITERFRALHESGIRTYAFMMHGLPEAQEFSYEQSVTLMAGIRPNVIRSSIFFPLPNTALGKGYTHSTNGSRSSLIGDIPQSITDKKNVALNEFYLFGWWINAALGLSEYGKLIKDFNDLNGHIDVDELKEIDKRTSSILTQAGKEHYQFAHECSMLKLVTD